MRKFVMLIVIALLAVVMTGCACCGICGGGKKSCAPKPASETNAAVEKTK